MMWQDNYRLMQMTKDMFFEFDSKIFSSFILACPVELTDEQLSVNHQINLIKGDYDAFNFPINFMQNDGKKFTDILDTGWPSRYLISSRLKEILDNHYFTGWKSFPIRLFDKKSNEIFGYHGFSVTGKCAKIDYTNSKIIEKQFSPSGPICKFYKGISIDTDHWDGSDFFCPEGSLVIYVTQRVGKALKENKVTNLRLVDIAEKEVDFSNVKNQ